MPSRGRTRRRRRSRGPRRPRGTRFALRSSRRRSNAQDSRSNAPMGMEIAATTRRRTAPLRRGRPIGPSRPSPSAVGCVVGTSSRHHLPGVAARRGSGPRRSLTPTGHQTRGRPLTPSGQLASISSRTPWRAVRDPPRGTRPSPSRASTAHRRRHQVRGVESPGPGPQRRGQHLGRVLQDRGSHSSPARRSTFGEIRDEATFPPIAHWNSSARNWFRKSTTSGSSGR